MTYGELHNARHQKRQYIEGLSFDPTDSTYFDRIREKLKLTEEEVDIFRRHGFVSVDHLQRHSFGSAYYQIYSGDLPVLVTTDSILNALHQSFDSLLLELEMYLLIPALADVLQGCHETLSARPAPEGMSESYQDVDLYLTAARNLLASGNRRQRNQPAGSLKVASRFGQNDEVRVLLELIRLEQIQVPFRDNPTDIYGGSRFVDYSQFKPRGHYTKPPLSQHRGFPADQLRPTEYGPGTASGIALARIRSNRGSTV